MYVYVKIWLIINKKEIDLTYARRVMEVYTLISSKVDSKIRVINFIVEKENFVQKFKTN